MEENRILPTDKDRIRCCMIILAKVARTQLMTQSHNEIFVNTYTLQVFMISLVKTENVTPCSHKYIHIHGHSVRCFYVYDVQCYWGCLYPSSLRPKKVLSRHAEADVLHQRPKIVNVAVCIQLTVA